MAVDIKFIVDGNEFGSMQEAIEYAIVIANATQQDVPIDRCVKYTTRKDRECGTVFTMTLQMAQGFAMNAVEPQNPFTPQTEVIPQWQDRIAQQPYKHNTPNTPQR